MKFTEKQQYAYNLILDGKNVFITGSSGTGKSAIIKNFVKDIKYKKHIKFAITSTTGTSAIIIGGTTIHSYLGIGLGRDDIDVLYDKICSKKYIKKKWTQLHILIIDEISMLQPYLFEKIERLARMIRENDKPFGGIQLILTGDFLQLPAIKCDKFCFESETWKECIYETVYLTQIIRQSDTVFQNCLNNIRIGNLDDETLKVLESRLDKKLDNKDGIIPTKLFSLRDNVDFVNNQELGKLAEDDRQFYSYNMEVNIIKKSKKYLLNNIRKYCNVNQELELCLGAQVMLCKNLDFEKKLVNGSRGIIIGFDRDDLPIVKFINGITQVIDFETWEIEDNDEVVAEIYQVPLKVAFAISIHSCQGSTLDYVEINLGNIFEYGQAYVALSRVKNLEGLSVSNLDPKLIKAHPVAIDFYNKLKY